MTKVFSSPAALAAAAGTHVGTGEWLSVDQQRIDQFADFDPRRDYELTVADAELTTVEREASATCDARGVDDIRIDL